MNAKIHQWPLRIIYSRLLDIVGRVGVFPVVLSCYLTTIQNSFPPPIIMMLQGVCYTVAALILTRELFGMRKSVTAALGLLMMKINDPNVKIDRLSPIEITVFNLWMFRVFSRSPLLLTSWLHAKGDFVQPESAAPSLRTWYVDNINRKLGVETIAMESGQGDTVLDAETRRSLAYAINPINKDIGIHSTVAGYTRNKKHKLKNQNRGSAMDTEMRPTTTSTTTTTTSDRNRNEGESETGEHFDSDDDE